MGQELLSRLRKFYCDSLDKKSVNVANKLLAQQTPITLYPKSYKIDLSQKSQPPRHQFQQRTRVLLPSNVYLWLYFNILSSILSQPPLNHQYISKLLLLYSAWLVTILTSLCIPTVIIGIGVMWNSPQLLLHWLDRRSYVRIILWLVFLGHLKLNL